MNPCVVYRRDEAGNIRYLGGSYEHHKVGYGKLKAFSSTSVYRPTLCSRCKQSLCCVHWHVRRTKLIVTSTSNLDLLKRLNVWGQKPGVASNLAVFDAIDITKGSDSDTFPLQVL
ncbi:hypothetical protein ElyMa_001200000 [Elysia marginata]|uniref:Uncharacterized protein n=1 Tax=Elysia marginata TaxID=1093978 RepID=A0AAV4I520_9GAST|nr:hypothetical protein ElyMa_001200000 [Elysia marginata]